MESIKSYPLDTRVGELIEEMKKRKETIEEIDFTDKEAIVHFRKEDDEDETNS